MKKTTLKLIALVMLAVMLTSMFCACGKSKMNVTIGAKLGEDYITYQYNANADNEEFIIPQDDRICLNDVTIEVQYEEGSQVSVLDVFKNAAIEYELDYELDSSGESISSINKYGGFSGTDEEGKVLVFFWSYTINGVEPTSGRAGTNYVNEGDKIEFILTSASEDDFDEDAY